MKSSMIASNRLRYRFILLTLAASAFVRESWSTFWGSDSLFPVNRAVQRGRLCLIGLTALVFLSVGGHHSNGASVACPVTTMIGHLITLLLG